MAKIKMSPLANKKTNVQPKGGMPKANPHKERLGLTSPSKSMKASGGAGKKVGGTGQRSITIDKSKVCDYPKILQ